jgi:hypothetical protein
MELFKALSLVIQVFMLIVCGFVFAQWKRINLTSLTEITTVPTLKLRVSENC